MITNRDPRDVALQSVTPTVVVPLFGEFEPLQQRGRRILVANDGLWMEARQPGIYSRQRIAVLDSVALPYGTVAACIDLGCSQIPRSELHKFVEYARAHMPDEVAMAMVWDDRTASLKTVVLEPISSSPGHIQYKRPDLDEHQHVVADIHSHGRSKAFFSRTDNEDDRGDMKIAIVVGNLDTPQPTVKARFCTYGHYQALNLTL